MTFAGVDVPAAESLRHFVERVTGSATMISVSPDEDESGVAANAAMALDVVVEAAATEVEEACTTTGEDVAEASPSTHPLRTVVVVEHMVVIGAVWTTSLMVDVEGITVDEVSLEGGAPRTPVGGTRWRSSSRTNGVAAFRAPTESMSPDAGAAEGVVGVEMSVAFAMSTEVEAVLRLDALVVDEDEAVAEAARAQGLEKAGDST